MSDRDFWASRGLSPPPRDNAYDVMQVCLNGHQITDRLEESPYEAKPFCPQCGAKTIVACPECKTPIQGYLKLYEFGEASLPNNCHACGTAYPWRQDALAAAIEAVEMELEGQDATDAAALIAAVSVDTPRTELSALRLKKLLGKLSKPVYDVAIKIVSDVAAATAKSHLGL
ncbi:MAG: DUF2321 domain-containing protein [Rhodopila sp.]|jgi:hypothetical protein